MLHLFSGRLPQTHSVEPDAKDKRDYKFEENFPVNVPEPKQFQHQIEPFIDCGYILACVPSAFTTINSWYLDKQLSWRYLYANIEHIRGGVRLRDTAQSLKNFGQIDDDLMPQSEYHRAENQKEELKEMTEPMRELALRNRSGRYYFIGKRKYLKQAILLAPVVVVLKTDRYWHDLRQKIIRYHWWLWHRKHAIVIYGWTDRYWLIADSRGKKKRQLDINHPMLNAVFITKNEDL